MERVIRDKTEDEQNVEAFLTSCASAINRGAAEELSQLWDPEGVLMPADAPAMAGGSRIGKWLARWCAAYHHELDCELTWSLVLGEWAFADGRYLLRSVLREGGGVRLADGKYLLVLRRGPAGRWRIFRYCDNSCLPPANSGR
jgi:ketosteroid isomerase-like protein